LLGPTSAKTKKQKKWEDWELGVVVLVYVLCGLGREVVSLILGWVCGEMEYVLVLHVGSDC
jgi:hypothetical protein